MPHLAVAGWPGRRVSKIPKHQQYLVPPTVGSGSRLNGEKVPMCGDDGPAHCQPKKCLPGTTQWTLIRELVGISLSLLILLTATSAHASSSATQHFLCGGDPLDAFEFYCGLDAVDIPNSNEDRVPGAFIVLRWNKSSIKLPRTNNAGVPSYSDGRWRRRTLDPDHPDFAQQRGKVGLYSFER